jgi:tetratricopeptide (TPR) repeat protein
MRQAAQPPASLQRGLVALQQGQFAEARTALEEASRTAPANPYVWSSLAETYLRLEEPTKASSAAATAEKLGGKNPVIHQALGMFYFEFAQRLLQKQDFTQAANVLDGALRTHPDDPQLLLALGVARYGQRRFDDATVRFLQVVRVDPTIEQPYVFLGKMLDQAGSHLNEITRAYERWAAGNPKNAQAQLLLAKTLLVNDPQDARAEGLLRKSIALDASNWEAHYELGVLLSAKRNYREAAAELARASELEPQQPMPHYHLARVYDRLGDAERAKAEREKHQALVSPQERR